MKHLSPPAVFITEQTTRDPRAMTRAENMIAAMDCGSVDTVTDDDLRHIVVERGWASHPAWGVNDDPHDPDVVFTMARFDDSEAEQKARMAAYPELAARDLWGYTHFWYRDDGDADKREAWQGIICQSAWQLHSITGCPFRCAYCGMGGMMRVHVNIEDYIDRMDRLFALDPAQRLFKWDNRSDVSAFEPEYDASQPFVEYFAEMPDKFLEIYIGKSANTDGLLDLDPKGKTIMQWSIGAETQSTVFEPNTDPWRDRIEAARRLQQAGYIVRYRFSPIIPVANWREENAELIARIFERSNPDIISLCAFGWMDVDRARELLDFSLLDPQIVAAMESAAPFLRERGYASGGGRPIPHDARYSMLSFLIDEIRKHSDDVIIALCLETPEMWRALGDRTGQKPGHYVCSCGPDSVPGTPLYDHMLGGCTACST